VLAQPDPKITLEKLLSAPRPEPESIARLLDGLSHAERMHCVLELRRAQLQALYARVEGFARLGLDDLVPQSCAPFAAVTHHGRYSLPLFTRFQKRFYRLGDPAAVGGANFQSTSWLTGPGYFVARPSERGDQIVIDYSQLPEQAPQGWPALRDNDHGISRLVFAGMTDTLRRVSQHVSIGAAAKRGKEIEAYFVLCREA
jgi:hypothetical protein